MINLTWLQLAHPQFQQALQVIWDAPNMDGKTSYTAGRIKQAFAKVDKDVKDLRLLLIQKYSKKGEDGKQVVDARGFIQFESPETAKEFEEAFQKEFTERKLELKVSKLKFDAIVNVRGITPAMWEHLELIVEDLPEVMEPAPETPEPGSEVAEG